MTFTTRHVRKQCTCNDYQPVCKWVETTPEEACGLAHPHANQKCAETTGEYQVRAERLGICPDSYTVDKARNTLTISTQRICVPFH